MPYIAQADAQRYYQLWKTGATARELEEEFCGSHLGTRAMKRALYKELMPEFLHYCRKQSKLDFREGYERGGFNHIVLTEERRQEFLEHLMSGLDQNQTAELMGIPIPTLFDVWYKEDPEFQFRVQTIQLIRNAALVKAMTRKAFGRKYLSRSVSKTNGIGEGGVRINQTTTTLTEKQIEGDFQAQKFLAINWMPEKYSENGQKSGNGNLGAIMGAIDAAVETGTQEYEAEHPEARVEP